jgi:hypothetical protein
MKLHFRNMLLTLPEPINDAPIAHDTKPISRMHSGMESYNESSCRAVISLPELKTKCERYAPEAASP